MKPSISAMSPALSMFTANASVVESLPAGVDGVSRRPGLYVVQRRIEKVKLRLVRTIRVVGPQRTPTADRLLQTGAIAFGVVALPQAFADADSAALAAMILVNSQQRTCSPANDAIFGK
jgi:hypothetical protein